jgi:protein SCO1/2
MSTAAPRRPARLLAAGLLVCGALAGCANGATGTGGAPVAVINSPSSTSPLQGTQLSPPRPMPAFTLTDTAGHPFALRPDTAGKVVLMYFGYTHCPDVCPIIMADVAAAIRDVPAAVARQVDVVFITVDPTRDTAPVLRAWLDHFTGNPARWVGLLGPMPQIVAAQEAAGVPQAERDPSSASGYTVSHSAELLAFTADHQAHVVYLTGPQLTEQIAHDLPLLVQGKA